MIEVVLSHPWLEARFDRPLRALSWAPHNPGFVATDRVLWREVRNADLTEGFDALAWLSEEMAARGQAQSVAMLTSRNVRQYRLETACLGRVQASCAATVGLTNAERVGQRLAPAATTWGTINLTVAVSEGLTDTARIEALSIATQARTAAILNFGPDLPTGKATGTGTDCIVVAAPEGDTAYAGLHTEIGEVIGRAVYDAVAAGTRDWMAEGIG